MSRIARVLHRAVALRAVFLAAIATLGALHLQPSAHADERTDYLVRLLQTSTAFRVRAQAAVSLGSVPPDPAVLQALSTAVRDENSAVRAAAASSLGRLGDASVLPALRGLERDPEAAVRTAATEAIAALQRPVASAGSASRTATVPAGGAGSAPSGPPRYYVGIGVPGSRVSTVDAGVLRGARAYIERSLTSMQGVVVAPDSESVAAASRVLRDRSLAGFFIDSSVTVLEQRPDGALRASVSVVVQDYPGRNVRSMLTGSATVSGESGATAQRTAIEAALGSALRNLGTAMAASSGSRR